MTALILSLALAALWQPPANDKVLEQLDAAVRANPMSAEALVQRGNHHGSVRQDFRKAWSDYQEAIRIDPKNAKAYLGRGVIWMVQGNNDKALENFNEAVKLDPKLTIALQTRGSFWQNQRKFDEAIADYSEAIKLSPKATKLYMLRGNAYAEKASYTEALADYDLAAKLNPRDAAAISGKAGVFQKQREFAKALAEFERAAKLDPYEEIWLAWFLATCSDDKSRNGKRALEIMQRLVTTPADAAWDELDVLAAAQAEAGEFDKAAKTQQAAIEKTLPGDRAALTERLKLYQAKKAFRE